MSCCSAIVILNSSPNLGCFNSVEALVVQDAYFILEINAAFMHLSKESIRKVHFMNPLTRSFKVSK